MTDHKALVEIRAKPYFENNRINRWIEKIQEFDFTIEYVKGAFMTDADALSRQFESEGNTEELKVVDSKREALNEKQKEGKIKKHRADVGGKRYRNIQQKKDVRY